MRVHTSFLAVAPLLIVAACTAKKDAATSNDTAVASAPPSTMVTDESAVRRAIDSANTRFLDALTRGDTSAAVANYAPDAVVMFSNEGAWRGADAVRKGFAGMLSQVAVKDGHATTDDVMVAGDLALETGHYEWTLVPKGGKELKDKGKYLTAWKRQPDGSWKIVRDISNTDLPAKM
jgi:uncharacterized protein (TIGR02246 family)